MKILCHPVQFHQPLKAARKVVISSQQVLVLLLTSERSGAAQVVIHFETTAQTAPNVHLDYLTVGLRERRKSVQEHLKISLQLVIMAVQRAIKQVSYLANFLASKVLGHLSCNVGDHIEVLILVGAETLTVIPYQRNSPAADKHVALLNVINRYFCSFDAEFVGPHLDPKKIVMTVLLPFVDQARLHDGERRSSKCQYTRKERLEVVEDIAPAITAVLPIDHSRLAEEYWWQDYCAKNDANQNPKFCYLITRHRASPNVTTRLNNMHFLKSAESPVGALAA
ncbi:hypothetical protein ACQZ6V_10365 [Agrobacterium sp. 22-3674b3]